MVFRGDVVYTGDTHVALGLLDGRAQVVGEVGCVAQEVPERVAERELALKRHGDNVSRRVQELSRQSYWSQFDSSPEFVILFIPGDQFLSAALAEEPDLIEYALSQQIILATPTSFVAQL